MESVDTVDAVERLRRLCLRLPGTSERRSHGAPAFFVGTTEKSARMFAMADEHHHGAARVGVWCAAPDGVQQEMIDEDPSRFFRPPYVGPRGWLGMYLDAGVDWDEVAAVVIEAFGCVAPAALRSRLDG